MHLHKCDHVNCFTGRVVRLTAKPRYLLLLHHGNEKYNTVTALLETDFFLLHLWSNLHVLNIPKLHESVLRRLGAALKANGGKTSLKTILPISQVFTLF